MRLQHCCNLISVINQSLIPQLMINISYVNPIKAGPFLGGDQLAVGFPQDGTSRDKPGRDVPLSLCPGTKKNLVPVSLCPGTRAGAKIPGQTPLYLF